MYDYFCKILLAIIGGAGALAMMFVAILLYAAPFLLACVFVKWYFFGGI